MFIHFFGLLLDRRTALELNISDALDTEQVRIVAVDGLDDKTDKQYYLCPRGTLTKGLRAIRPLLPSPRGEQRLEAMLTNKCVDHVRTTLGADYRAPYLEGDEVRSAMLMCSQPQTGWYSFLASDARDISTFET